MDKAKRPEGRKEEDSYRCHRDHLRIETQCHFRCGRALPQVGQQCHPAGGSEAIHSNQAIGQILQEALVGTGIPEDAIQIFPFKEREAIQEMLQLEDQIDLIIPRGGEELIRFVTRSFTDTGPQTL